MADADLSLLMVCSRYQARGSSLYTRRLLRGLAGEGVDSTVLTARAGALAEEKSTEVRVIEQARLDNPVLGRVALSLALPKLAAAPPDVIHAQSRSNLGRAQWLARVLDRPLVVTVHHHLRAHDRFRVDRGVCHKVLAVSESVKSDILRRSRCPESLVDVIPSGVEYWPDEHAPPPLAPQRLPVVGTAGPLEAIKGFPFFLGAARRVVDAGRDVEFVVAGSGPEEANLRRMARELGLADRVTFVPYGGDFVDALSAMDLFVLPSLQQGLGTIMLEAMSLGRAVIATGVGGVYSVVKDGETGLIVPPSDHRALAVRILDLLDHPDRARALGSAARQLVRTQFSVKRMVDDTLRVYREIACSHRAPLLTAGTG